MDLGVMRAWPFGWASVGEGWMVVTGMEKRWMEKGG